MMSALVERRIKSEFVVDCTFAADGGSIGLGSTIALER
jgi:hypothetical protein